MLIIGLIVIAVAIAYFHFRWKCPICETSDVIKETDKLGYCFKCARYYIER